MAWLYLIIAGLMEIGWPLGLKLSQTTNHKIGGIVLAAVCMIGSGGLLWLAQREISIGTAYAIWTGVGAVGTLLVGILMFGDSTNAVRIASALLIVAGMVGLKLTHA
ncbi:MAG: multidrug efflux SMR transporter [Chloroflexi bacterium]|nr:multidrug efflux SMR transporter [Chloroflexota bacterium]